MMQPSECRIPDERRCTARSKQRQDRCRQAAVAAGVCHYHGAAALANRPARPRQSSGLYGRKLITPEEQTLYTQVLDAIKADVPGILAEQLALEVATQAAAIGRNGMPTDEAGQAALARKSGVIAKLVVAAAAARAEQPKDSTYTLTIAAPGANGAVTVRTSAGPAVAIKAPDGSMLLPDGRGAYVPAVKRDVDGVEVWSPTLELSAGDNE